MGKGIREESESGDIFTSDKLQFSTSGFPQLTIP